MKMPNDAFEKIESIVLLLRTKQKRFAAKRDIPFDFYIGRHKWRLANPRVEELDKGNKGVFDLAVPAEMTSEWFRYLCLKKPQQKSKDDWYILELKLEINGKVVYHKENTEIKIKADSTSWCAPDFDFGGSK